MMKKINIKLDEGTAPPETPEELVRRMFKSIGIYPEQEQVDGIVNIAKKTCVATIEFPDDSDIKANIFDLFKFPLNIPPDLKAVVDSIIKL